MNLSIVICISDIYGEREGDMKVSIVWCTLRTKKMENTVVLATMVMYVTYKVLMVINM